MKTIEYKLQQIDGFVDVSIGYNETNLEIAKREAYKGKYIIYDDEGGEA